VVKSFLGEEAVLLTEPSLSNIGEEEFTGF